jgi:integrative and conjugative element protein (TIGR02256 family)
MILTIGQSGQTLVISDDVLGHFEAHRQRRFFDKEAGGQLFARLEDQAVLIEEATGPRPSDVRRRTSYAADRAAEQAEIEERFARGLHFVGDWHTHPERRPTPSPQDAESIAEAFRLSRHGLNGFVLIIVGQDRPPDGLHVSIHDAAAGYRLRPGLEPLALKRSPITWI